MPYKDQSQQREYHRLRAARIRNEWLSGKTCLHCGSEHQLQIDHINPAHKVSHRIWSWSQERREAELVKCQVLCETCHFKKTAADRKALVQHGSTTMYKAYGCRCEACKKAKSIENAKRKPRMKAFSGDS